MEPSNKCNLWSTSLQCLLPHLIFTNKAFSPCNNKYESLHNTRSTSNIRFFHINLFWIQTQTTKLGKCTVSSNSGNLPLFCRRDRRLLLYQKKVKRLGPHLQRSCLPILLIRPVMIPFVKVEGISEYHDLKSTPQTQHLEILSYMGAMFSF